jgi:hypothetical protein
VSKTRLRWLTLENSELTKRTLSEWLGPLGTSQENTQKQFLLCGDIALLGKISLRAARAAFLYPSRAGANWVRFAKVHKVHKAAVGKAQIKTRI